VTLHKTFKIVYSALAGYAVAQLVEAMRYTSEGRGFDSPWLTYSFRSHYGPGVDSASNSNEYQEYLLGGVKTTGVQDLYVPNVLKSDSLNPLEPSGPLQACNGITLLFYIQRLQLTAQRKDIRSV